MDQTPKIEPAAPPPRCGYMPPEGISAIEHARQHYGTEGDFAALRDRFGCRAPARYEAVEEDDADAVLQACDAHLGAMLEDRCWTVHPIWSGHEPKISDFVQITITEQTVGISRAGFGPAMLLGSTTHPRVDDASEYVPSKLVNTDYLEALKTIQEASARAAIERDRHLYGTGFGRLRPGGTLEHIPAPEMQVDHGRFSGGTWGESPLQQWYVAALRTAASALGSALGSESCGRCGASIGQYGEDLASHRCLSGHQPSTLAATVDSGDSREICRVPGDATARWITTIRGVDPASGRRAEVRLDGRNTFAQVDEHGCGDFDLRDVTASADTVGWLQRMNLLGATFELDCGPTFHSYTAKFSTLHVLAPNLVTLRFAALHVNGIGLDAPYVVGEAVEWRREPLGGWLPGIVTSIVDDRPNDGVDKPYWVVRIDSAGERQFCGPPLSVMVRRRTVPGAAPRRLTLTCGDENVTLLPTSVVPVTARPGLRIVAPLPDTASLAWLTRWRACPVTIDDGPRRYVLSCLELAGGRDQDEVLTIELTELVTLSSGCISHVLAL